MKEYRVKKKLRLWMYILASLVIIIYGGMTIVILIFPNAITENPNDQNPKWLPILFIVMIVIMLLSIIIIKKSKIIITDKSIISSTIFYRKELEFSEIKSFDEVPNPKFFLLKDIVIVPKASDKKHIAFNNLIEKTDEFIFYLNSNLANLDAELIKNQKLENQIEEQEILQNIRFNSSIEDKERILKKAHLVAKKLNIIGVFTAVWLILFPIPYKLAVISGVLIPIIAILTIKFFKGLILVEERKYNLKPSVSGALFVPGLALTFKTLFDFQIDDYSNVWIPVVFVAILFVGLLVIGNKEFYLKQVKTYVKMIVLMIPMLFYSYGAIILLNCCFDKSTPKVLTTTIMNRETEGEGFNTTYFLNLNTWHKGKDVEKILVKKDLYDQLQEGDEIAVYIFKGKFNIPWIVVDRAR
jgi:hypothetical protein